jgi:archaellum component FlaC
LNSRIQLIREEGVENIVQTGESIKSDLNLFRGELEGLSEEIKKAIEEIGTFNEKIKVSFTEIKEDLGSMIKLSYGDLERRLEALETRVKALEKLVLG